MPSRGQHAFGVVPFDYDYFPYIGWRLMQPLSHGPADMQEDTLKMAELTGYAIVIQRANVRFIFSRPNSPEDARTGRICTRTGWWAAGRDIGYYNGKPYIRQYLPVKGNGIREL